MIGSRESYLEVLQEIVSQPTAPYHEERVAARVVAYLREWGIPFSVDDAGNLIARYQRGPACRPLILMAHMDHPAFTIKAQGGPEGADWTASLEGYVKPEYFERPVAVKLYPRSQGASSAGVPAQVIAYTQSPQPGDRDIDLHLRLDDPSTAALIQPGDFGTWDLADYELRGGVVHARAIDDLVGCASMLLTLWHASSERWDTDVYAVFTRAEEDGLVGAYALLQSGMLPRDGYIVSLEASPALPGALQGAGPVIRAGDRITTFSQDAELLLKAAAYHIGSDVWRPSRSAPPADGRTNVQRQLMSGGSCEGTTAILLGYQATGMAIPLGNYHNMAEGSLLAPEYIHAADYLTGVDLLQEAARLLPEIDRIRTDHATGYAPDANQIERLRKPFVIENA
jgi:putative aminopeptidase FrvX